MFLSCCDHQSSFRIHSAARFIHVWTSLAPNCGGAYAAQRPDQLIRSGRQTHSLGTICRAALRSAAGLDFVSATFTLDATFLVLQAVIRCKVVTLWSISPITYESCYNCAGSEAMTSIAEVICYPYTIVRLSYSVITDRDRIARSSGQRTTSEAFVLLLPLLFDASLAFVTSTLDPCLEAPEWMSSSFDLGRDCHLCLFCRVAIHSFPWEHFGALTVLEVDTCSSNRAFLRRLATVVTLHTWSSD